MRNKNNVKLYIAIALAAAFGIAGCAPVTVSSTPPGAKVYTKKNDELIGITPVKVNMVAGNKEIIVRKDGYFSKTLVLSSIDPESTTVELKRRERVMIISEPVSAELYVEGVGRVGVTPCKLDYDKPYRTFLVKAPGYAAQTFTVPEDPEDHILIQLDRDDAVLVVSRPKNAEIFDLDGNSLGSTPLAVPADEERTFAMSKDGYYTQEFTVGMDTKSPVVIELDREPIILIQSEPEGAYIVYQGVTLGRTPFRHLVNEPMEIEIKAARYYSKRITISPDSPRLVEVELKSMPYVTIKSKPEGATLYRSGGVELVGTTPVEVLIENDTAFEMHKEGFDPKLFTLSPESNSEVTVPLLQSIEADEKYVTIDSQPSGADIYRPGGAELIGKTPYKQRVRGERTYELHLDGYETKIVTVATDSADSVVFALAKDESARNVTVSDPLLNTPSSF